VAAVRRAWPDILAWIFKHKRTTWTLLSEHATVHDYDGSKVVLGISTVGIANTVRHGPHADLVRQALIDVLGVDARVEGIPVPDAALSKPSGEPHPSVRPGDTVGGFGSASGPDSGTDPGSRSSDSASAPASSSSAGSAHVSSSDPGARGPAGSTGPSTSAAAGASALADAGISPSTVTPESGSGGWASAPAAPGDGPSWASGPDADDLRGAAPAPIGSRLERARAEVTAEPVVDDTGVADDRPARAHDEVLVARVEGGRPVIERLLGGKVIDEG
jgi:DNA polymerase-3 subunit gamma/tau